MDPYAGLNYVATWAELAIYPGGTDPVYLISYQEIGAYALAPGAPPGYPGSATGGGIFYFVSPGSLLQRWIRLRAFFNSFL